MAAKEKAAAKPRRRAVVVNSHNDPYLNDPAIQAIGNWFGTTPSLGITGKPSRINRQQKRSWKRGRK